MGVCPGVSGLGASSGAERICVRKSGEAPIKNQTRLSGENAICVCVRGFACSVPARSPEQLRQAQFHWGKPPPAAEPRILIFTRGFSRGQSGTANWAGGPKTDRHKTARPPWRSGPTTQNYSSALAYELTSQFRSISSCCGVTHSIAMAPSFMSNPQSAGQLKDTTRIRGKEQGLSEFLTSDSGKVRTQKDEHQAKVISACTQLFCYMSS